MPNMRRQFHSCEACRKSHLGCDARQRDRGRPCFNCARRRKECIVKWEKVPLKGTDKNTSCLQEPPTIPLSQATQVANRRQEGEVLDSALLKTFSKGSIITLALSLDNHSSIEKKKISKLSSFGNTSNSRALTAAVRAFAFKFFIAGGHSTRGPNSAQSQACHTFIWAEAIRLAKQAMKNRSYQSILTLHIIGLASLSINIPEKPQGFEVGCFDSASRHMKRIQEVERVNLDIDRRHRSEITYWCVALTENACQLNQLQRLAETSLFSEKSQVWTVVRERTSLFHQSFRSLHGMNEPMSKEVVSAILQHATLHKCMTWWNINNMKSYAESDEILDVLFQTAARDMLTFRDVFSPLLDLAGRDFLILNPKDQLSYGKCHLSY
ncbi:hypothetical protein N7478_011841 [Penicillium angulare]|uniref:uncharacterized protein n=1 Tax=Penicillium angulare TaxID=116970 RepID=UPI0025400906|nr:uncharacterized protein N7478_011841 [Penicillium angulare]KAJ5261246.1 hypothetical protein N7478_011841 [Penicillium angulare]